MPALMVIESVPGAYTEVTVSGTGWRVIGLGAGQPVHRKFGATNRDDPANWACR